jgi:transketolase
LQEDGHGVRVVSLVSRELFLAQDETYRETVLPGNVERRILIEAALPMGWETIVGPKGRVIGIEEFGASAPGEIVLEKKGITAAAIIHRLIYSLDGENIFIASSKSHH